jgi:3alpha(or 20beta)-hydroxysteroid dehydrogenase
MAGRFEGKVVVVTGGTRGMGEAIVRQLIAEGCTVVFGGRDLRAGGVIADQLGPAAHFVKLDVACEADWRSIVDLALGISGKIDGLVNNAGVSMANPLAETSVEVLADLVAVNQTGVLLGIKHVVGPMRAAGGGSIVNIGSVAVRRGMAGLSAYSGVKAAVAGISRAAAMELAPDQIRVNTVHPGPFATKMLTDALGEEGLAYVASVTPLGRVGQPREIAGPVLFLLCEESSYVTGAELSVDGGRGL